MTVVEPERALDTLRLDQTKASINTAINPAKASCQHVGRNLGMALMQAGMHARSRDRPYLKRRKHDDSG